ncbi:MAG TPA: maleylpyruvate isomerase family mycothiol-dependent enzyme [Chloroflexota bacterium]|nr:maleylpyruvate isomerase family mycothiol-dependent enzyme [Chloroflexota bacterium]
MQTPTAQAPDFATVLEAIRREYEVLDRWLTALHAQAWQGPTACSEWPVYKVVSHLGSGAEITLQTLQEQVGGGPPADQEARQRVWSHFDSLAAPQPLHDEFRDRNQQFFAYLDKLPAGEREHRVKFFAGELPLPGYLLYRLGEFTMHSWDVRVGLDPTARLLASTIGPYLPQALGTMNRRANKDAKQALDGTAWNVALWGPVERQFAVVVRNGNVEAVDEPPGTPAASLRTSDEAFCRLCVGRLPLEQAERDGEVDIGGDRAIALRLNQLFPGF